MYKRPHTPKECEGINGKNSEFHAALGLCQLDTFSENTQKRKIASDLYTESLSDLPVRLLKPGNDLEYNYSYYPVVFESEKDLLKSMEFLNSKNIFPRRYFYPSLNKLPFIKAGSCPVAESISKRVLCLPLSVYIDQDEIGQVTELMRKSFKS